MAENKNIDQLKEQGWEEMSSLLDTHMPIEKNRPVVWWYWLAAAAAMIALLILAWPSTLNDEVPGTSIVTTSDEPVHLEENQSGQTPATSDITDNSITNNTPGQIATMDIDSNSEIVREDNLARTHIDDGISPFARSTTAGENSAEEISSLTPKETFAIAPAKSISAELSPIGTLPASPLLLIEDKTSKASSILLDQEDRSIDIPIDRGKFQLLAFSELMWAVSDRFGFVNLGPGVAFEKNKWKIGVSAGLAIPVPNQKTFNNTNESFSKLYNFSQELSSRVDYSSNSSAGVVYYENYKMNPGFKFDVFGQIRVSPLWSLGMDIGGISYQWDFSQMAIPNQTVAAQTDLTDLKNQMWYGGLSLGFHPGDHWQINAGMRIINPGDPRNIGVLPSLRLQYGF